MKKEKVNRLGKETFKFNSFNENKNDFWNNLDFFHNYRNNHGNERTKQQQQQPVV